MWPAHVEEIAAVFRAAGAEARLEELPLGEEEFPGQAVDAVAVDCDGRLVVALVPWEREHDPRKLAAAASCSVARPVDAPPFPYRGATQVLIERVLLGLPVVWIEAGTPRYVAGVSAADLAGIVKAKPADLLAEA